MLADTVDFIDDPVAPEEIAAEELNDDVEMAENTDDDDDGWPAGSGELVRIPGASRIYIPHVGPRPTPRIPPLNDDLEIEFVQINPKRPGSA